jgi:hypothetical protein
MVAIFSAIGNRNAKQDFNKQGENGGMVFKKMMLSKKYK